MVDNKIIKKSAEYFDIAIIGGSFSGITTAMAIAKINNNIKIAIIDKFDFNNKIKPDDGKTLAISNSSIDFYNSLNLDFKLFADSAPIKDIKITNKNLLAEKISGIDNARGGFLNFQWNDSNNNVDFGRIIESNIFYHNLLKNLANFSNITAICPADYQNIIFGDDVNIIEFPDKLINCRLLIACDGKKSKIRDLLKIGYYYKNYHQIATIFKIKHSQNHQNIAWEKFLPTGPLAILPIKDCNQSGIVWINNEKHSKIINSLDEQNFILQLQKILDNQLGEIAIVSDKQYYNLSLTESISFYNNRVALIGDCAASINPIAGQGLNLAIKGIAILQQEIANHLKLHNDLIGKPLFLAEFQSRFKKEVLQMIIATDVLNSIFESGNPILNNLSNIGLNIINKSKKLKNFFITRAGG